LSAVTRRDGYLALDCYAALSDGRSIALVGADGSIDWWCVPDMDSTPFFDRLLDAVDGGRFSITPVEPWEVQRRYLPDSNVLEQVFTTTSGTARVIDSLNSNGAGRLPWSELARRVEGLNGRVEFRVEAVVGRRLDQATPWRESSPHGDILHVDGVIAALRSDGQMQRLEVSDRGVVARLVTHAGSREVVALLAAADEPLILPPMSVVDRRIDRSDAAWREWVANLSVAEPYRDVVTRSALALKLLVFSPTGAIAAAGSSSLPEQIGGEKNYDYRYAWVRDVAYTTKAFLRVGATEEAKAAFAWLMATIRRHETKLCTMFTLNGERSPDERVLDLPGYANSSPVRVGNHARDQLQLSVFGDVLETAALFVAQGHVLDLATRRVLAVLADQCADVWRQRDAGIWELDEPQHYTISKIGCWMALDRAVALADLGQIDGSRRLRWLHERNHIRDFIDATCWSDAKQSYTQYAGTNRLDASLLLATRFGFDNQGRLAATRDAVRNELCRGPLVYRYSDQEGSEGTFIACGFWLVEAFALLGDRAAAIEQMDGMLRLTQGNLGLLAEQMDAKSGAMLGNLPQALSHLALIHAAESITAVPTVNST
jgi:GH15 family glucan-1,4-alpha-glucosidase